MPGARHRVFYSAAPEPITFTIFGELRDGSGGWEEDFTCVGAAPPSVIITLMGAVSIDTKGRAAYQVPALIRFVRELLVDEDLDRWSALMGDKNRLLRGEVLADLVEWLSEEVFGRPLVRSTGSASSPSPPQTSSTPASPPPASDPATAPPTTSSPPPPPSS